MTCPFCGANLPDNSDFCDACGTPIASWQSQSNSYNLNDALFNPASTPTSTSTYSSSYAGTKSSSNGMIKLISTIVVLALVFIVAYNLFGFKYMGTYELTSIEIGGIELDLGLYELAANDSVDMSIKILPLNRAKVDMQTLDGSNKGYSKVKISGSTIKLSHPDTGFTISGKYDRKKKTISLDIPLDELVPGEDLSALGLDNTDFSFIFEKK